MLPHACIPSKNVTLHLPCPRNCAEDNEIKVTGSIPKGVHLMMGLTFLAQGSDDDSIIFYWMPIIYPALCF